MTIIQKNQERNPILTNAVLWAGSILFLIPNFLFTFQGFLSRYWADDYCFSGFIKKFGFIDGLTVFYSTTSNRFSAFIFTGLSELFGDIAIRIIPPLVIISLGFLLYRVISSALEKNQFMLSRRIAFLYSQTILFFILFLSPNIDQSVYWRSGLTHYFLPIPILLLLVAIIFFAKRIEQISIKKSLLVFFTAVFNAGLSESYAALQLGLFGLLLFYAIFSSSIKDRKSALLKIILILVGTAAAMIIMILSPGNSLRLDSLQQAPDFLSIILISTSSAFNFIKFSIRGLWLPFGVMFGISILAAFYFIRSQTVKYKDINLIFAFVLIALAVFGLIICVCAPTAYGMMAFPEQRVLMLAHIVLVLGIFFEGVIFGLFFQKYFYASKILQSFSLILVLIFCLYPLSTLNTRTTELSIYTNRAELWDNRNSDIRSQIDFGKIELVVDALDSFSEIAELNQDEKFWVNQCAANYYGVESITAVERK